MVCLAVAKALVLSVAHHLSSFALPTFSCRGFRSLRRLEPFEFMNFRLELSVAFPQEGWVQVFL